MLFAGAAVLVGSPIAGHFITFRHCLILLYFMIIFNLINGILSFDFFRLKFFHLASLHDATGDYSLSFYVTGSMVFLSGLIGFLLPEVAEWESKRFRAAKTEFGNPNQKIAAPVNLDELVEMVSEINANLGNR